ncbi:glycosyltransferase [Alloacidobacterium dinghuense]|uniref:glycosyltransferase family protein n=1 Tax=Alloacidobacterium dinghuense TaxID=2763107 RepID=UPI001C96F2DA|nr:glycosyltransferase [Alloacidobacterium dinghuense]
MEDRFGALHFLAPVLAGSCTAFFTNGDDEILQRTWAREQGMSPNASLESILLAQIESHRTEVFYNLDPMRYSSEFVRKLPGCVRRTVAWRAAPSPGADFSRYDLVVCNFPTILKSYEARGWRAAYFAPAHDPVMDEYALNNDRPIDVLFVGGYSRHHTRRAAVLEAVAALRDHYRIEFCLNRSRFTRLAESPLGRLAPLGKYRRPKEIRAISRDPVFGRRLYSLISKSKIVLNGAIDMAGEDRGNMRCFEAMGCSALLLSDAGVYPDGMRDNETLLTYASPSKAHGLVRCVLNDWTCYAEMAKRATRVMRSLYNKEGQWEEFTRLVSDI